MNISRFLVIAILLAGNAGMSLAEPPPVLSESDPHEATIESYRKELQDSNDSEEKALLHKKLGDLYVTRDAYKNAAEEYIRALSVRQKFSPLERLRMAVAISWGDRLDEAVTEFRSLVDEDPQNSDARIHLARTLSWSGRFDESLIEVEAVLGRYPDSRDALLIKANVLRWKGENDEALILYRALLDKQENFDARLGYTYALFARGDEAGARESMALLTAAYPYQENELKKLRDELNKPKPAQQVRGDAKFTNYRDNDGNDVNRYAATYSFPVSDLKNQFSYVHIEARDRLRRNNADIVSAEIRAQMTRQLGVGAGLGVISYRNGDAPDFPVGHLKADAETPLGSVGVTLSREPFTDTADLLEKRIRVAAARVYLSRGLFGRTSFYGGYGYADYSDGNNSDDLLLSLRHDLRRENPRMSAGYRFRYLDFNRQSSGGYFDPNYFVSHQLYLNTAFEKERFSGAAELYIGQQSYKRNGAGQNEMFSGGAASIGYKLTKNYAVEANVEGGDYALQTATGFSYFLYGFRLSGLW